MGNEINRRGFIKASLLGAAAVAVASTAVAKETLSPLVAEAADLAAPVQTLSEFPYKVTEDYKRFPADKDIYLRGFDPEENKNPIKFIIDDVSEINGTKDTGKDLPFLNAEKLGIKGRPATFVETYISFSTRYFVINSPKDREGWSGLEQALSASAWQLARDVGGNTEAGSGPGGIQQRYPIDPVTNELSKETVLVPDIPMKYQK
jgi:epoxyqueuosine reductase